MDAEENQIQSGWLYNELKSHIGEVNHKLIKNHRRTRKGVILFETASPQHQLQVQSALIGTLPTVLEGFEGSVIAYGAVARKELVIRGVPLEVEEETIVNSNLGLIHGDSVTRLNTYFEGKKQPSTTVMIKATSDEAASKLLSDGLKAGDLLISEVSIKIRVPPVCYVCGRQGHVARGCSEKEAKNINFDSIDDADQFCYKCKLTGHRFRQCTASVPPFCINCQVKGHWPTDWQCPCRNPAQGKKGNTDNISHEAASYKEAMVRGDVQAQKVRIKNLENRVTRCEERDEIQAKGLRSTRKVLGDVALVATKQKKDLTESSKREITDWYEFEKMLAESKRLRTRTRNVDAKVQTPDKNSRARDKRKNHSRSSLERVRSEKKITKPMLFDTTLLEGLEEEADMSAEEADFQMGVSQDIPE